MVTKLRVCNQSVQYLFLFQAARTHFSLEWSKGQHSWKISKHEYGLNIILLLLMPNCWKEYISEEWIWASFQILESSFVLFLFIWAPKMQFILMIHK